VRPGERAQVEPSEHGVAELHQLDGEPVAAGPGHVLDVARRDEGGEQAGDGARVDPRAAGNLVRAQLAPVPERVEDDERTLDRRDVPNGWLAGAGRGTLLEYEF